MVAEREFHQEQALFKRIQEQFDYSPYPVTDIDNLPSDRAALYYNSIATPFYRRNRQIVEPAGKTILDVGCGSGYKTLLLALANPGARIVGVDLSDRSLEIARDRFAHHGLKAEFHQLSLFDLPQKLLEDFDYINCDEILYLMPDPADALSTLKLLLKPEGILRGNLHSLYQRFHYYRAQEVFKIMGLMDENPEDEEIGSAIATLKALKPNVDLKKTWKPAYEGQHQKHAILMNYLFQGDKGFTIPDMFDLLSKAELQFISMVNWKQWNIFDLFDRNQEWPDILKLVPHLSTKQLLHSFELFHPIHRLLDFWCGHPMQQQDWSPIEDSLATQREDLTEKTVHLHPQLKRSHCKSLLLDHVNNFMSCDLNMLLPLQERQFIVDSMAAFTLVPLWKDPKTVRAIARHWLALHPINPATQEPPTEQDAIEVVSSLVQELESAGYVLLS